MLNGTFWDYFKNICEISGLVGLLERKNNKFWI